MAEPSQQQVTDLEALAQARFGELSQAELKLLRAAPKGEAAWCGPSDKDDDPLNDPTKADEWGHEREIRADLIRWLCVDRHAAGTIDPKGIQVHAARITGGLDLSFVSVPFRLLLRRCRLMENTNLISTGLPALDLAGSEVLSINADGADVKGDVFLNNDFNAEGEVRLLGAQIGGSLECAGGRFKNPGDNALSLDGADVRGGVFLTDCFSAEGEVRLLGAQIGGDITCDGGTFNNPGRDALSLDGADVRGGVFLRDRFRAHGEVRLLGAKIGGDLDCSGGTLNSLIADTSTIKGNFFWLRVNDPEATALDLSNASAGSIIDDEKSWPKPGNLSLDGFIYERFSGDRTPKDVGTRLKWLALQDKFAPQPYRQLAKVLRETGDEDGALAVLQEMERLRRKREDCTWPARLESGVLRRTIGYGYDPLLAVYWIAGLTGLGWILYRRAYLAGNIVPKEKGAYESFKRDGAPPEHYTKFAPVVYAVENSLPLVKLGQDDSWHPEPNPEKALSHQKGSPTSLGQPRAWTRLRRLQELLISWGLYRDPNPENPIPPLQRFLVFCGLQPHPKPETPPSRFSRWLTSPRSLRWFLWIQILLGWLLATLFLAGVTGVVRKE
ncbi:MAG TPA: hypothetical protein VEO19_09095 [Terriglobia bacterium]|nr:hypothetical protein [Terriglobia bacterium]